MEPEELGRLIDRHSAALVLYARQRCDSAEDVVQDAFIRLSTQRPPPENPAAWLFRAVRNGAINAATAAHRRRRHEASAASGSPSWFEPSVPARDAPVIGPEEAEEALRALPIEHREVIVAHLWGRLTFQEIAVLNGCSSSTAHRLYQSGLNALRARLGVSCPTRNSQQIGPTRD